MRPFTSRSHGFRARVTLAVAGVGLVVATAVQADIPDAGVIHGCYGKPGTPQKGELRVRDASQREQCRFYENPLDWNQTGPTGPAGPSDTYYASGTATVGGPTVVALIALPPGNYLVSATGWGEASCPPLSECFNGRRDVECGIDGFHSGQDDDFFSVSVRDNIRETMAVHLDVALPNGGTVNIQCQATTGVLVGAQLTATAVGTLHGPTFS